MMGIVVLVQLMEFIWLQQVPGTVIGIVQQLAVDQLGCLVRIVVI